MSEKLRPARVIAPGRIIQDELDARGWSQQDLAAILNRPPQMVNEIIQAKKQITVETSRQLAMAFGTSPDFWLNLEMQYQLHRTEKRNNEAEITRRSALYELAPVGELIKRGWISKVSSMEELENEIYHFLQIHSIREQPEAVASYRISHDRGPEQRAKTAWLCRVKKLAAGQPLQPFDPKQMSQFIQELLSLTFQAQQTALIPEFFLDHGIHFLIVPHLPRTYLDGAALWVEDHPVVALTLRYDRIDAFWFTLLHEIAHLLEPTRQPYLDTLYDDEIVEWDNEEIMANQQACGWLIQPNALNTFIETNRPHYSKIAVETFAKQQKRHPGIIIGQLMHQKEIKYSHMRKYLVRVRPYLEKWVDVAIPPSLTI